MLFREIDAHNLYQNEMRCMNALLKSLIIFLYPGQCRYCGENLDPSDGHYICKSCWQQANFIGRPYCETCGYPMNPIIAFPEKIPSCDKCPENPHFRKTRSVANYDSAVGEAIQLLKYQGRTVMAKPLADLMIKAVPVFFGMESYDYIIPVPIHKEKRRKRGYNQMELIGERLSRAISIPLEKRSFIKILNNPPQISQPSSSDRLENVRGAFDVPDPSMIAGKKILLIDDVFTTGATANESAKTLIKKGKVKYVDTLTLARQTESKGVGGF